MHRHGCESAHHPYAEPLVYHLFRFAPGHNKQRHEGFREYADKLWTLRCHRPKDIGRTYQSIIEQFEQPVGEGAWLRPGNKLAHQMPNQCRPTSEQSNRRMTDNTGRELSPQECDCFRKEYGYARIIPSLGAEVARGRAVLRSARKS